VEKEEEVRGGGDTELKGRRRNGRVEERG